MQMVEADYWRCLWSCFRLSARWVLALPPAASWAAEQVCRRFGWKPFWGTLSTHGTLALVTFSILLVAVLNGCDEISKRGRTINAFVNARPNVRFVGYKEAPVYEPILYMPMVGEIPARKYFQMMQVRYVNEPSTRTEESVAREVTGRLQFRDRLSKSIIQEHLGSWAVGDGPEDAVPGGLSSSIVIYPNDKPSRLNVVLKWPEDEDAFVYPTKWTPEYPDGRNPSVRLPPGEYELIVKLAGVGVDLQDTFIVTNKGRDLALTLRKIDEQPGKGQ